MELRYLNRLVDVKPGTPYWVQLLQYRVRLNPLEAGLEDPIWSEWQDVPTVNENETEEG